MLNIITIQALRKSSSLAKPLKTLLLSLAVSDLGVGLLAQPLYIAFLVTKMKQNTNNNIYNTINEAHPISSHIFAGASFFGIIALSADRFLAIHLHLRYQELVTHKRVVAAVISIWLFSVFLSLIVNLRWIPEKMNDIIFITVQVVCYITTGLLYCKIYAAVRRHTNQIQVLQVQQVATNGEMVNNARLRKTAIGTFYVYLVILACYLPAFFIHVNLTICDQSTLLWHLEWYGLTLLFLNSCLNPLIYCWKMRHIRHAVVDVLRNIFPGHH